MIEPNKQLKLIDEKDIARAKRMQFFRSPYLLVGTLCYALLCVMIIFYLQKDPVYSSNMALVLPGSGLSSSFKIDDVGTANTQTKSPFAGASFNPRVNYKEMLKSREVVSNAASKVFMEIEKFGLPKIKLTQQTSIIEVDVDASSGELAKEKAWALYHSLQDHLDVLRADEALRRDESIKSVLDQYRSRLNQTRNALVEFQERSLLVDQQQVSQYMSLLNETQSKILFAKAELKRKQDFVNQLSFDLGVSPSLAGKAFALQTDTQFRGHLKELDESAKEYSEFRSMWGQNHPKVKASEKRLAFAQKVAFKRSAAVLGDVIAEELHVINLSESSDRARLFGDLMDSYAQLQGKEAEVKELEFAQQKVDDRLRVYARESKELERLQREYDLAEAVFTSAAARLEAGKSDVFASYPVVQLLTAPNTPIKQKSPSMKIAVLGGVAGFLFITTALLIVWQRSFLIRTLLAQKD